MAKKKQEVIEEPQIQEEKVVEQTITKEIKKPSNKWEIKDRIYYLKGRKKPLSRTIKSANVYWFDEEAGYERELKYCENQKTCFVDEMKGDQRLSHIIFRSGTLFVPREKTVLQKLLSLYHPHRDQLFYEYKPAEIAADEVDVLEQKVEA